MPNAPGMGPGGMGGTPPGGGPPPTAPNNPTRGTVPEVSNERRPGLTYNTHVAAEDEPATIEEELSLNRYQELVDEGEENERIVERVPKPRTEYVSKANQEKKYSILDPDAEPLDDEPVSEPKEDVERDTK